MSWYGRNDYMAGVCYEQQKGRLMIKKGRTASFS